MAEPGRAKTNGNPVTNPVTVNYNQTSGYSFTPPSSSVAYDGDQQFITARACWVWTWVGTTPTNVFEGQTGYYVVCNAGTNNFTPNVPSITIIALATNPNASQPPPPTDASVKGSISVGSMGEHHKQE